MHPSDLDHDLQALDPCQWLEALDIPQIPASLHINNIILCPPYVEHRKDFRTPSTPSIRNAFFFTRPT